MPFEYDLTPELKKILYKLRQRNPKKADIVYKKIREIVNSDESAIERYKYLRHDPKRRQRVHIDKHFVLTFKHEKESKFIRFLDFDHHDHAYQ